MNLQSYEHGLVVRIITYNVSIIICSPSSSSTQTWGPQWIFLGHFSIIYFSAFLLIVLTNSTTDIFSMASFNCRVKFKQLGSKTLNMNLFSSGSGFGFLLRKHSKVALITASFTPGRRFFHLGHKKRQTVESIFVLLSQHFPTLRVCKN